MSLRQFRAGEGAPAGVEFNRKAAAVRNRLMLEVICRLRSKVCGETEVTAQFRSFAERHPAQDSLWTLLLDDAVSVRSGALRGSRVAVPSVAG